MMAAKDVNYMPFLPSYPQMIVAAITALGKKKGSNKTSISKYIESVQRGNLPVPASHTTLLSHHLNRMKSTGELNYMKPDPNAPPKRGRGRPPKDPNAHPKPKLPNGSTRPRGRPRKTPKTADETSEMNETAAGTVAKMATGTGRPLLLSLKSVFKIRHKEMLNVEAVLVGKGSIVLFRCSSVH